MSITVQEAIEGFEIDNTLLGESEPGVVERNELAISALEKQIPKKWIGEYIGDGEVIWKCSACNEYWALMEGTPQDNEYNFCPKCGQALKQMGE